MKGSFHGENRQLNQQLLNPLSQKGLFDVLMGKVSEFGHNKFCFWAIKGNLLSAILA